MLDVAVEAYLAVKSAGQEAFEAARDLDLPRPNIRKAGEGARRKLGADEVARRVWAGALLHRRAILLYTINDIHVMTSQQRDCFHLPTESNVSSARSDLCCMDILSFCAALDALGSRCNKVKYHETLKHHQSTSKAYVKVSQNLIR